jgi:hypothetical protein
MITKTKNKNKIKQARAKVKGLRKDFLRKLS